MPVAIEVLSSSSTSFCGDDDDDDGGDGGCSDYSASMQLEMDHHVSKKVTLNRTYCYGVYWCQ